MRSFTLILFLWCAFVAPTPAQAVSDWPTKMEESVQSMRERWRVPGVAVAVIDGEETHVAGFGMADIGNSRTVTGDTPFYLASTGKLFTALAALKLASAGKAELHEPIDIDVPGFEIETRNDPGAITLHHLLTHTAGFDDRMIGYAARSLAERTPLRRYLAERMPPRVRPAGTVIGYSNHGFGLVGLLIEAISGRPFEAHVTEEILAPLGMQDTGYLPSGTGEIARSYGWRGDLRHLGFSNVAPAGGVAGSAADLARLMRAFLAPASNGIPPAVTRAMMSRQAVHHPGLAARGYAFWEHRFGTHVGWVIGGAAYGFSSALVILPEERLGIAVMLNRQEPGRALAMVEEWVQWRLQTGQPEPVPVPMADIADLAGTYRWIRYGSRSVERIAGHFMEVSLEVESETALAMEGLGQDGRWLHIGGGVFANTRDPSLRLAFDRTDPAPGYLFSNHLLTMPTAFERVSTWDTGSSRAMQLGAVVGVAALALVVFGMSGWRERRTPGSRSEARRAGVLLSSAMLLFIALAALSLRDFAENLAYGPNLWLRAATLWPAVIALAWAFFAYRVVVTWSVRGLASRIGYLWLLTAGLALLGLTARYHWWGWYF